MCKGRYRALRMIDEIIRIARVDPTMIRLFLITQTKAPPTIIAALLRCHIYASAGIFLSEWYDRRCSRPSVVHSEILFSLIGWTGYRHSSNIYLNKFSWYLNEKPAWLQINVSQTLFHNIIWYLHSICPILSYSE